MLRSFLEIGTDGVITLSSFALCAVVSLVLGVISAYSYMFRNKYSKGFVVILALLPLMVQVVITLVNGNLGVGVAVAGAFSLVRFRSAQGGGREMGAIFLAMAIGLATGMGYLGIAAILTLVVAGGQLVLMKSRFGNEGKAEKQLKITIPENLDYDGIFDEVFEKYTSKCEMTKVRTAQMGTVYELFYSVVLKDEVKIKDMLDDIRVRNGNLSVMFGKVDSTKQEL